jgi:hypothetical protein
MVEGITRDAQFFSPEMSSFLWEYPVCWSSILAGFHAVEGNRGTSRSGVKLTEKDGTIHTNKLSLKLVIIKCITMDKKIRQKGKSLCQELRCLSRDQPKVRHQDYLQWLLFLLFLPRQYELRVIFALQASILPIAVYFKISDLPLSDSPDHGI